MANRDSGGLLPRGLARFNKRVTNRIQGTFAPYLPPWAVIVHRGRRSGQEYRTPVLAWVAEGRFYVVLFYGSDSDWVRNVLAAGHSQVERRGRTLTISRARVVEAVEPELPSVVRLLARAPGSVLVADLSPS